MSQSFGVIIYVMPSPEQAAFSEMRQLLEASDTYLRDVIERDQIDKSLPFITVETPDGLEIRRFGDTMEVEAEFEEIVKGRVADVTYRVEWSPNTIGLPKVYREVWRGDQPKLFTVAKREFPEIARSLGALVGLI